MSSSSPSLTFGNGNAKLPQGIFTFSLPAGYTCPGSSACLAFANRETGKITDGSEQQFRCFAASGEALFPNVRKARWANYEALQAAGDRAGMASLILASLSTFAGIVRIHVSGDFFSPAYFLAWCDVAKARPEYSLLCVYEVTALCKSQCRRNPGQPYPDGFYWRQV